MQISLKVTTIYQNGSNKNIILLLLSGIFLGLAIFTKMPVFTMIPLIVFIILKRRTRSTAYNKTTVEQQPQDRVTASKL